ncbi:hypothetical protein WJX74_002109 [Apatococcus lobatus]|uniref:Chitin-binding type-2 domain-containing protein n=1 Tax=Apatococcus lobatus TaxID=904363 RepID=A0AAW1QY47_9CHLO
MALTSSARVLAIVLGQFVADTSSACKNYWQCTGAGQGNYQSCGSGTAFDSSCSCCNFPTAFTCASPTSTTASPPPPSPPSQTPPPTPQAAGSPAGVASCTTASQFVPDTSVGCSKFWQCTGPQQAVYQSCNTGLIFDTSCNCCNFPSSTNCKSSSGPAGPTTANSPSPPPPPSTPTSPASTNPGNNGLSGSGICSEYGTYTTDIMRSVACQNELGKSSDANTMVTAANFANTPGYNAQCGQCLRVTNLEGAGQLYVTIIDYKGAPGLDLNHGPATQMAGLYEKGHVQCKWETVDPSLCSFH